MLLATQQVNSNSRHATPGTDVWCPTSQGSHRDLFAALFLLHLISYHLACSSLPLPQPLPYLFHSSMHVFIHLFIPVSHQLPQSEEVTAPLCFVSMLFPLCQLVCQCQCPQPQLACTSGGGWGLQGWRSPLTLTRRGDAGCTGDLCCWFRVVGCASVVL